MFKEQENKKEITEFMLSICKEKLNIQEILSKYVQHKSISGNEQNAGEWLKNLCKENGLFIKQMGDKDGNYNFAASIYPLSQNLPNIILVNHIDVVPADDTEKWTFHPFSGKITDTDVWGRGAYDNKGPAIMQLFSIIDILRKYKEKKLPYNVTFLAVSCEETQNEGGIEFVVNNFLKELSPAVVIGEGPPGLKNIVKRKPNMPIFGVSTSHKRVFWIKLELEFKSSGHGSVPPPTYVNKEFTFALNRLLKKKQKVILNKLNTKLLRQFGEKEKGYKAFVLKNPRFFKTFIMHSLRKQPEIYALFTNTITLTSINSHNDIINSIPEKATALLDCRLLPLESNKDFLNRLKRRLKNDNIKVSVIKSMPEMHASDDKSEFFTHLKNAILNNYPESDVVSAFVPNHDDVGFFRIKNVLAFSIIPVIMDIKYLECIHNTNERIPISVLSKGQQTYKDFIERCLLGSDYNNLKK